MQSLSDLILQSQGSSRKNDKHHDDADDTGGAAGKNTSTSIRRTNNTTHHSPKERRYSTSKNINLNYLKESYKYDPVESFYEESKYKTDSNSNLRYKSPNLKPMDDGHGGFDDGINNTVSTPNKTDTSPIKFDFQANENERNFFQSTQSKQQRQQEVLRQRESAKKRRRSIFDDETKEEYEERIKLKKLIYARRKRFRTRKYNFDDEIDYGAAVSRMVKYQMDVKGTFKKIKADHNHGDVTARSQSDEIDTKDHKEVQNLDGNKLERTIKKTRIQSDDNEGDSVGSNDEESTADSDSPSSQYDKGKEHVLGSLLDRVQKQEQSIKVEDGDDEAGYEYGIAEMRANPISFQKQGYLAPLKNDPNTLQFSYINSSSSDIIGGIATNELFHTTFKQSKGTFGEEKDDQATKWKKLSSICPSTRKIVSANNVILPHFLPINCFNPNMLSLHNPRQCSDTYHYLPFSHQDPTDTRIITSNANSIQQLYNSHDSSQFYNSKIKVLRPLHFHSKNIHLFAARLIVSCAGLLSVYDNDNESGTTSLNQILSLLYRKQNTSSRTMVLIRQSQELASNYILWQHMEKTIEALYFQKILLDEEYHFLKQELMSSQSVMLTNENSTSDSLGLKEYTTPIRGRFYRYIEDLKDEISLHDQSSTLSSSNNDYSEKVPPWRPAFIYTKAKEVRNVNDLAKLGRGEKYSQAIHASDIDIDVIHLTLASLFSELCRQRSRQPIDLIDNKDVKLKEKKLHETIMAYLEKLTNEIWFIGVHQNASGKFYKEVLNAVKAKTVLLLQSYVVNGGAFDSDLCEENKKASDELSGDESDGSNAKAQLYGNSIFQSVAHKLVACGSDLRGDSKVKFFTDIHLTTGIAVLAKNLPSYAAEIISRPIICGHIGHQTPFDLMCRALEAIEENGDIMRTQIGFVAESDDYITVEKMITIMQEATEIFQECYDSDPRNLDCLCWFIATLIGTMILGSGITIGNGPTLACPPDFMIESNKIDARCRHRDYSEHRAAASYGVRLLISSQSEAPDEVSRRHFVIKNLLEWSEAMYLLSFRPTVNKCCLENMRLLHASHTIAWALKEPKMKTIHLILRLYNENLIARSKVLSFIAALVESDGTSSTSWALLAFSLGPLGTQSTSKRSGRLNQGYLNYKKIDRQRKRHDWWGLDASKWWDSHFFTCPSAMKVSTRTCLNGNDFFFKIRKRLDASSNQNINPITFLKETKQKVKRNLTDLSWMYSDKPSEEDEEDQVVTDSESEDSNFDKHSQLPSDNVPGNSVDTSMIEDLKKQLGDKFTIIVCKIVVACHLYGLDHTFVENSIQMLWVAFLEGEKDCVEFDALSFLHRQNLNVVSYLKQLKLKITMRGRPRETDKSVDFGSTNMNMEKPAKLSEPDNEENKNDEFHYSFPFCFATL